MVHLFVQEARQLKNTIEGKPMSPMIEILINEKKKYSKSLKDIGANGQCYWNEHIFLEFKDMVRSA
jgi:Ca2+-dependent lipid-binding protein